MTEELNTPMGVGISAKRGETQEAPKKVQEVPKKVQEVPDQPQVEYNEPPQVVYEPVAPFRPVDYTPNQFREDAERKIRDDQTITDTTLRESPTFLNAATIIARKDYPDTWNEMTNEELTTSFLTKLNRNTYNIPRAVSTAMEYDEATPEEVAAMAYGMEMYEEKSPSWEGTAGAMWALASDPTVLGSIMSLGAGTVVREGAKRTVVTALRESLGKRMTALAAVDAGLWTGLDDAAQQNLRMAVDLQEGYDPVQGAMSAALGAAAGAGLWKGGQAVAKGMGNLGRWAEEGMAQAAGGGTPYYHGTNAEFSEFDRAGNRITSMGYGHYFTPNKGTAEEYGKIIKEINIDDTNFLDWNNLSDAEAKKIGARLIESIPEDMILGYAKPKKKYFSKNNLDEADKFFNEQLELTKDAYHDRAKPSYEKDGKGFYIQYVDPNDISLDKSEMKYIAQQFDQGIARDMGYKGAKDKNEIVIYDTDLVNESITSQGDK